MIIIGIPLTIINILTDHLLDFFTDLDNWMFMVYIRAKEKE